jgi:hypothetical protein
VGDQREVAQLDQVARDLEVDVVLSSRRISMSRDASDFIGL